MYFFKKNIRIAAAFFFLLGMSAISGFSQDCDLNVPRATYDKQFIDGAPKPNKRFEVRLYPHTNFEGTPIIIKSISELTYDQLNNCGWNDVISSIKIKGNAKVVLYEHSDKEGEKKVYLTSKKDLQKGLKKFNDMASSITVTTRMMRN